MLKRKPRVGDRIISYGIESRVIATEGVCKNSSGATWDLTQRYDLVLCHFESSFKYLGVGNWFVRWNDEIERIVNSGPYLSNQGTKINV